MQLRTLVLAILVTGGSFAGATLAMHWMPAGPRADRPPPLATVPPLPQETRTSTVVMPAVIALSAIREAMERDAPRDFAGSRKAPISRFLSNSEVGWTATRGALALSGRSDALIAGMVISGTARATGHVSREAAGSVSNAISGFLGQDVGRSVERLAARSFDQRADIRGNVFLMSRPAITNAWRFDPNLSAQVTIADVNLNVAGSKLNVAGEVRPYIERSVHDQVEALQTRLRNDAFLERIGRREWARMCRSIQLPATAAGVPNLWLEVKPTRAFAAQPRIDANAVTLTLGVQAETRIVPAETKPDCPFPANLEIVAQTEQGRINIGVPVDVPFTELNRLIEARLAGRTISVDRGRGLNVTIKGARLAASGDRLLISLDVAADEKKSWLGLAAQATFHVWGKLALDRDQQILRFADVKVAVESESAFGLLGLAAQAAEPYLVAAITENTVVDLKPFAVNARRSVEAAIADFRTGGEGVQVDAALTSFRLVDLAFDAQTLRLYTQAEGRAQVAVTSLPAR